MEGISSLQGPHNVAQKVRKMTFPLKSFSPTVLPVNSVRLNSGALSLSILGRIPNFKNRLRQTRIRKAKKQTQNVFRLHFIDLSPRPSTVSFELSKKKTWTAKR